MADALERVTNLLALLLETQRPLTLDDISNALPAYPHGSVAARGAFERDKAMLRDVGFRQIDRKHPELIPQGRLILHARR